MQNKPKPHQINTKSPVRKDNVPRQPNERDESSDQHSSAPRADMKQAAIDVENGLVDTDLYGARGVGEAAKSPAIKNKRPKTRAP
ncbi:hypothetical protein [Glaciimonas immobilis]|uniref:Uncharacterized protein n=1 Tax=Glaciimonas immobilis TaxID=728004 RepID=A0A840RY53_9BURK|nr:hypothetical protein [Glaciimonas immobilis]KAF3996320.1 hypothetical protein HAV38_19070 [Glaciimonas immobilis]MBB5202152.1 hypothetical protein [Glaciimonas immobilis]